jgi:SAM-dependent methyltransferase
MTDDDARRPPIDASKPSSARMYDYLLDGKDNYQADRAAVDKILEVFPGAKATAREARKFMRRSAQVLARDHGVDQYLDIGTGIPTEPNLHQSVQEINPAARVVYVDNDPVVLAHARALMAGTPEGRTAYVHADVTDPLAICAAPELTEVLDLTRPVALSLIGVLHFLEGDDTPYRIVRTLMRRLAPGSYLVASHATTDLDEGERSADGITRYNQSGVYLRARTRAEFLQFFEGLELLPPGVVSSAKWGSLDISKARAAESSVFVGVGRKP